MRAIPVKSFGALFVVAFSPHYRRRLRGFGAVMALLRRRPCSPSR